MPVFFGLESMFQIPDARSAKHNSHLAGKHTLYMLRGPLRHIVNTDMCHLQHAHHYLELQVTWKRILLCFISQDPKLPWYFFSSITPLQDDLQLWSQATLVLCRGSQNQLIKLCHCFHVWFLALIKNIGECVKELSTSIWMCLPRQAVFILGSSRPPSQGRIPWKGMLSLPYSDFINLTSQQTGWPAGLLYFHFPVHPWESIFVT